MTVFLAGLFMLSPNDQSVAKVFFFFALGYFKCPCLAFVVAFIFLLSYVVLLILSHLLNKYTLFFCCLLFLSFIPGPCLSPSSGFLFVCFSGSRGAM